jgi:NAD(P)-dependent dehydrogenase (short-subunit alcohol dehydrogenase family)
MAPYKSMQGKVCLVTGATLGIGKVTAQALADKGATVVIVGRNPQKTADTVAEIKAATENPQVMAIVADLSSQAEVRRVASEFLAQHSQLHVLVNNAGAAFTSRHTTVDGLEMTFALDHLAYFLLTTLLLPTLKASAPARIVNVASDAHRGAKINFADLQSERRYTTFGAYGQAKLANIMFTYELARQLRGTGVTANTLHPGFVASGFAKNNGAALKFIMSTVVRPMQISVEKGAQTSIYLASSPEVEGVTGQYFDKSKPVKSNPASYNEADQQRLWEISEQLVGLPVGV